MEKTCPCSEKHCFQNQLRCRRGKEHFGLATDFADFSESSDSTEEKAVILMRKCGHFLHHTAQYSANSTSLLQALTAEEKKTLEKLLEKCLQSWQTENR
ncbi:MAG: hypothetical protein ACI4LB_03140 [Candidatus Fimenecus sp.]